MKKLLSLLLALSLVMSVFTCLGFSAAAEGTDTLAVTVNGITTDVAVGDTFTYTYTLTDVQIINVEAYISYDSNMLSVTTVSEDDEDAYIEYLEQVFPKINDSVVCNTDLTDKIRYNCSRVTKYRFTGEEVLATFEFTALCAGETTIDTVLLEMVDQNKEFYVEKGENGSEIRKDFTFGEFITYETVVEPTELPTDAPTDEPTDAPTEEPTDAPTEEPTDAPTEEPTDAPTEEPTDAPTDEPTDAPTEEPTDAPTEEPTDAPTEEPTVAPTDEPTDAPTEEPTDAPTEPEAVKITNIQTSPSATNIKFTWDAVEDAVKYWVYKYNPDTDKWASAASALTNEAVVKLLDAGTEYQFKVICKLSDGTMLSLNDADLIIESTSAAVATGSISGTADVVEATIKWDAVEGATKYWVYKAKSEEGPYYIYSSAYETSLLVRKLKPDTDYYFRVVALTENNGIPTISDVNDSPTVHIRTTAASQITTVLDTVTSNTVSISWPQYKNADKYWLVRSTTTNDPELRGQWTSVKSTTDISNLTYTFTGLDNNETYYFNVVARFTDDNGTVRTLNYIPVEVRTLYSDEEFITFTPVDDTTVTLTLPEDLNVQKVWAYAFDENGEQVALASTTTNTVTLKNLGDYTKYSFKLRVLDLNGKYGYITPESGEAYHE